MMSPEQYRQHACGRKVPFTSRSEARVTARLTEDRSGGGRMKPYATENHGGLRMGDEPVPYYPEMPCHTAPLPPGETPEDGCHCRICEWARRRASVEPIKPGTHAWNALLEASR